MTRVGSVSKSNSLGHVLLQTPRCYTEDMTQQLPFPAVYRCCYVCHCVQVCEEAVELLVGAVFQGPSTAPPPASRVTGEDCQQL